VLVGERVQQLHQGAPGSLRRDRLRRRACGGLGLGGPFLTVGAGPGRVRVLLGRLRRGIGRCGGGFGLLCRRMRGDLGGDGLTSHPVRGRLLGRLLLDGFLVDRFLLDGGLLGRGLHLVAVVLGRRRLAADRVLVLRTRLAGALGVLLRAAGVVLTAVLVPA